MNDSNQNLHRGIISLIRSAIENEPAILPDFFDWNEAMRIVESHGIAAVIYYGARKSIIQLPSAIQDRLKQLTYEAVVIDECQTEEISRLFQELSVQNIDYMPLKGVLLKRLYPNSEMRYMGDADILIRLNQYSVISRIMEHLGYTEMLESDHEFKWTKPPYMVVELHKRIIPSYNKDYYAYYGDGWQLAHHSLKDDSGYEMIVEDEYIFMFTHFAKHYRDGGIGIKHLIDFQVFKDKHTDLNHDYIMKELKKLRLYQFYLNVSETLEVWFCDARSSDMTNHITERIFASGAYGTYEGGLFASAVKKMKSEATASEFRRNRIINAIFAPSLIHDIYPTSKKMPILLPVFWIVRIANILLFRRESIRRKQKELGFVSFEKTKQYQRELNYVGLDFHFKE